jgi:16S rRNA (guanine527-N7)-methyltransferase
MAVLLPPVAEYGNRTSSGPMRKPAITHRRRPGRLKRHQREHFSLRQIPETDAGAAAQRARAILEDELTALPGLAGSIAPAALDRLERYVALLLEANARINLTRLVEPAAIARLHLLDALAALPLLDAVDPALAVDLGSGGGVPAVPLAIARPRIRWLLVDSVERKAAELRSMVEALGLDHVSVRAERAELVGRDAAWREHAELVTARACAALPVLAELAMPLLRVGGTLLAWKGPLDARAPEVVHGDRALGLLGGDHPRIVPAGPTALGGHTFVLARKRETTPGGYPRRPGDPGRHPLG